LALYGGGITTVNKNNQYMQKLFFSSMIVAIAAVSLTACRQSSVKGKGEVVTEAREVQTFNGVDIGGPLDARITIDASAPPSLVLKGQKNLLAHIKTEMHGNMLRIYHDGPITKHFTFTLFSNSKHNEDIIAEITVPSLTALSISGAGDAKIKGVINTEDFNLDVSGAGDIDIDELNANNLTTTLSGAGDLTVSNGKVNIADMKISGLGDINAKRLDCNTVNASVSGAGDMDISVTEKLDVHISGLGDVTYKGNPAVTSSISGAGSLNRSH
jgi:hypothetical protein